MGKNKAAIGQEDLSEETGVSIETEGCLGASLGASQVGSQDRTVQTEPKHLLRSRPGKKLGAFSELIEGLSGKQRVERGAPDEAGKTTQEVTEGTG